jgi:hypothetical protein
MDTAEHMFTKCKQLTGTLTLTPSTAETLADLFYEIGKDKLNNRSHEAAIIWLERAYDTLGGQEMELLSPEATELRLSTMHNIGMCLVSSKVDRADNIHSPGIHEAGHT